MQEKEATSCTRAANEHTSYVIMMISVLKGQQTTH